LHDIGKVGRGSHVVTGVEIAAGVLDRVGVDAPTRDAVLFLVREHLLLSDTATRRNLEDEDLILHVAARIGDPHRLAMLYLLTVADAAATGPAASTPWRLGLIRDLVAKVRRAFERGHMDRDRAGRLERAESEIRTVLQAQAFTTELGVALDVFEVGPAFEEQVGEERWRRFRTTLRHAMEGRIDVRDRIDRLRAHYRPARGDLPVTVKVDQGTSDF